MEESNKEQTPDYGVVLYEKSTAKHALDAPTGKVSAKGWAQRIYMILLAVALFGWFLYSLISAATDPEIGVGKAIVNHIASFFVLFVAIMILIVSAFNLWGKFIRAMLKFKSLRRHYGRSAAEYRQLKEEFAQVEANKEKEYAIRVYRDCVFVIDKGETKIIHSAEIKRVKCEPDPRANLHGYQITFELYDDESVIAGMPLSASDVPLFRKHFDNFEYIPATRGKAYIKKKLSTLAFVLIPTLIGVALLVVRSLVLPDMPFIFGAFFLAVGLIMIVAQFSDIAVIGNGVMGILFGLVFTGLPIAITLTIIDLVEEITFATVFATFTPLHAGLSVFFGFGPMLIIIGIAGLVDCFRL